MLGPVERDDENEISFQSIDLNTGLSDENFLSSESIYIRAKEAFRSGNPEKAMEWYQLALSVTPGSAEVLIKMGEVFESQGKLQRALSSYEKAVEYNSESASALIHAARILIVLGDDTKAESYCAEASKRSFSMCEWGEIAEMCGRYHDALHYYSASINIKPDDAKAWKGHGDVLLQIGKKDIALDSYLKAIEYDVEGDYLEPLRWNCGVLESELGIGLDVALNSFASSMFGVQQEWSARQLYEVGQKLQKYSGLPKEALYAYEEALLLGPAFSELFLSHANVLITLHRFDEAVESRSWAVHMEYNSFFSLSVLPDSFGDLRGISLPPPYIEDCPEITE